MVIADDRSGFRSTRPVGSVWPEESGATGGQSGSDRPDDRSISERAIELPEGGGGVGDERAPFPVLAGPLLGGGGGRSDRPAPGGRASGRRVPMDRIEWVVEQYRTRYFEFMAKHFHEHLVA